MIRTSINSLIVAALTYLGIMVFLQFPILPISPTIWAGKYFELQTVMALYFVYAVLLWAIFGAVIASFMLLLRPKKIVLYGLASAVAFVVTMNSWFLFQDQNTYGYIRELVFVSTIPYLYSIYVRMGRKRYNLALKSDLRDAARPTAP